jgi:hypothetical protein
MGQREHILPRIAELHLGAPGLPQQADVQLF